MIITHYELKERLPKVQVAVNHDTSHEVSLPPDMSDLDDINYNEIYF